MRPARALAARSALLALATGWNGAPIAARDIPVPHTPYKAAEVNATNDPSAIYSQASVAISPADPRHIVAASNTIQVSAPVAVFVSRDRGATYARSSLPRSLGSVAHDSAMSPAVAFDRDGNAFCFYLLGRTAFDPHRPVVAILPAGKTAWEGPFPATPTALDDDKPCLVVDAAAASPYRGRIYVAWDRNNADGSQNVYLGRSDGARAWLPAVRVDDAGASGYAIYAVPATGPNGEVYVVWNDYAQANGGSLKLDRSLDGGATFGPDRTVTDLRLNLQPDPADPYSIYAIPAQPLRGIGACPSVGVDVSDGPRRGWVYVCYADRAPGKGHDDVDVFVRRSVDRGVTWSAPVRVNDDTGANSQFMPWMSVDPVDGSLNIAYYDAREDAANRKAHLMAARSLDGGITFEASARVTALPSDQSTGTGDPAGNDFGDNLGIAALGGQVACAWTDNRGGQLNQVWAATLIQPGTPPATPRQALCSVNVPAGAALAARAITFSASLVGPSSSLVPEWEVKPAGVSFIGAGTVLGTPVAYRGAPLSVALPLSGLAAGGHQWRVRARRADGLGVPGAWTEFGSVPGAADVTLGARYTLADAARALRVAGGVFSGTPGDLARLGTSFALTGQPCDTRMSLADAVAIARAAVVH